jgi:nickel/cobalt transporter (NicO) family protein
MTIGTRRLALVSGLLITLGCAPLASRADTVASLLGNFTINQYCGLQLTDASVGMHYGVVFGQLPALRELHLADANGDGVTSQAERDAYVQRLAPEFANHLSVTVDGKTVPLRLTHWTSSLPTEQGGFSLRLDADFSGVLPEGVSRGVHSLNFTNNNYEGRIGWREIAVSAVPAVHVFNTDAYGSSLTGGLTEALQALPATGPLDEHSVRMSFTSGVAPTGSTPLQPRPGTATAQTAASAQPVANGETVWLQTQTRRLVELISTPHVELRVAIIALLTALVLGALHALSPGHGKTIVGAYLIGSRGTARHAVFLGFTVTVTHTLGVFALGFATLFASRYVVPERLFPILSLLSGLLVFGMGVILLAQRWRAASIAPSTGCPSAYREIKHERPIYFRHPLYSSGHGNSHAHTPDMDAAVGHEHQHTLAGGLTHSHGGSVHSHLPPGSDGAKVTWRSLLALGISGGLIPCPSAMVLLLAAVALNKTAYGLALVMAFSVGLAMTLTMIGLAFLYARNRFRSPRGTARWVNLLPVLSAGVITVVGAALCVGALQSAR